MKTPILLPSETQSREFDAKLLLARALVEHGHPVFVGSRMEMHKQIHKLPRGIYLAKDINRSSTRMLNIMTDLGIAIAAWDEEAMSIADIPTFQDRRIGPGNLALIKGLFALGEQNQEAVETHPDYSGQPIWITGNPRSDLLKPSLRGYFNDEAEALRAQYGEFILVNSNFGRLNHFLEHERAHRDADGQWVNIAQGTPEWWTYRQAVLDSFIALLPELAARYPERNIVLRPHPSESPQIWRDLLAGHDNVKVVHDGAVQPWLLASAVAIHNMCTTGIESYLLDHPVISYEEIPSDDQRESLANALSQPAHSKGALFDLLDEIFAKAPSSFKPSQKALSQLEYEMGPQEGALASERIAQLVTTHAADWSKTSKKTVKDVVLGQAKARLRKLTKQINSHRSGHKNSAAYTKLRWPGLELSDVTARLTRMDELSGRTAPVQISQISPQIFKLAR